MNYDSYKEIPLKTFLKVLSDGSKQEELLPTLTKKQWEDFKQEFEAENPTPELELKLEMQQKVMKPSALLKMYSTLVQCCLLAPENWHMFFEAAGVKKKETLVDSLKYVNTLSAKEQVRYNISEAEFRRFLEDLPVSEDPEGDIFDVISSLGAVTGQRLDYNTSTIGELLAEQKLAENIAQRADVGR